jgi:hypothetical protein
VRFLRASSMVPALGVVPPSSRLSQSSTRAVPPVWAAMVDSTESESQTHLRRRLRDFKADQGTVLEIRVSAGSIKRSRVTDSLIFRKVNLKESKSDGADYMWREWVWQSGSDVIAARLFWVVYPRCICDCDT